MLNREINTVWATHLARQRPARRQHGVVLALGGALTAAAAALVTAVFLVPPPLVFPVTATGLVVAAATMGVLAWGSPGEVGATRLVFWDFAGALTLLGLCAALFGEPEQAAALLERNRM
jgi:hypothetical protein